MVCRPDAIFTGNQHHSTAVLLSKPQPAGKCGAPLQPLIASLPCQCSSCCQLLSHPNHPQLLCTSAAGHHAAAPHTWCGSNKTAIAPQLTLSLQTPQPCSSILVSPCEHRAGGPSPPPRCASAEGHTYCLLGWWGHHGLHCCPAQQATS